MLGALRSCEKGQGSNANCVDSDRIYLPTRITATGISPLGHQWFFCKCVERLNLAEAGTHGKNSTIFFVAMGPMGLQVGPRKLHRLLGQNKNNTTNEAAQERLDTRAAHPLTSDARVYARMFPVPHWHGNTQTHIPPRLRKTKPHGSDIKFKSPHCAPLTTYGNVTRPDPQRHAAFTRTCSLPPRRTADYTDIQQCNTKPRLKLPVVRPELPDAASHTTPYTPFTKFLLLSDRVPHGPTGSAVYGRARPLPQAVHRLSAGLTTGSRPHGRRSRAPWISRGMVVRGCSGCTRHSVFCLCVCPWF